MKTKQSKNMLEKNTQQSCQSNKFMKIIIKIVALLIFSMPLIVVDVLAANKLTMEETEVLVKKIRGFISIDHSIKESFREPIEKALINETTEMSKKTPYRIDRMTIVNSIFYADNRIINNYGLELKHLKSQGLTKSEIIKLIKSSEFKKEMQKQACSIPLSSLAIEEYNIWYEFNYYDESNSTYMCSITIKDCN